METEKRRTFIINFTYFLILAVLTVCLVKYAMPMLAPFVLGFVIAYILRPLTRYIHKKLRLPYKPVALLVVLVFYGTIGLLLTLVGLKAVAWIGTLLDVLPHIYAEHLVPALSEIFTHVEALALQMDISLVSLISSFENELLQYLGNMVSALSSHAVAAASSFATAIPALFIKLVLMVISTFFIAADYEVLTGFCKRQLGVNARTVAHQVKEYVIGTLFVCIRSYIIIMSLTFVELSLGLSIIGIKHAILIAGLVAIFDILPVLGTGGIMIPWALITLLRGDLSLALALLLVYVAITVIRNIVEPKIVGSQLGLHPVVTLASMFTGVQLLGVIGLFGFPIVLSLLRYLNNTGTIHLFKSEQSA